MIFINFEVACGDRSEIIKIFDFDIISRMGRTEKFINIIYRKKIERAKNENVLH